MKKFLFSLAGAAFLTVTASASIIPSYTTSTTSAGVTTYNYDVQLDGQQNLISGNELCIAGIAGLTGTPTAQAGWSATNSSGVCPIAAGTTSANVGSSVLYVYSGATQLGPVDLGIFSFQSTFSTVGTQNDAYGAIAQKKSNLSLTANQGELNGPVSSVPEPTSLSLLGAGLLGLGLLKRRKVQE